MQAGTTIVIDREGRRRPLEDAASGDSLAHLLLDQATRRFLMSAGLDLQVRGDGVQVPVNSLLRALPSAAAQLALAPKEVRATLAAHNVGASKLLHLAEALESGTSLRDELMVPWGDRRPALSLVAAPETPSNSLLAMAEVDADNVEAFLHHLAALPEDRQLPTETLHDAVVPLLDDEATVGAAASVLARFGVSSSAEALERALARVKQQTNRLAVIAALVRLGRRDLGLRTLRSIVRHGDQAGRRGAIETVVDLAEEADKAFMRELMAVVKGVERLMVAVALYRTGEQSAYAVIAEEMERLTEETLGADASVALRVMESLASRRFAPLVEEYRGREVRPLLQRRAGLVAARLARDGADEATPQEIMDLAEEAYFQNRPSEARERLEAMVELGCKNPRALYIYANCLKDEGHQEDALAACDRALGVDASYWRSHRLRGSLLWDLGRHEEALEAYDRALNLNPVDPYTWYYKGYVLYRLRRDEEALPCLDRALSLKGDSPYIHNQKAFCLERLGRHEDAVRSYQRSLQLRPEDLTIRDYLGQALQQCSRLSDALECYDQVLRVDAVRAETIYHRADVLYDMERWEEAAAGFELYVELESDSYNGWFYRGLCLRFMGSYGEAAECFKRALLLRPDSVNARRHLVYCEERAD